MSIFILRDPNQDNEDEDGLIYGVYNSLVIMVIIGIVIFLITKLF